MRWCAGIDRGLEYATLAVEAASRTDDVVLRCGVLVVQGDSLFRAGRGIQQAQMDEALALERSLPDWPLRGGPAECHCQQLIWAVDLAAGRSLLLQVYDARRTANDTGNEAWALWNLGLLEWRAGNWDEADRYATAAISSATPLFQEASRAGIPIPARA
jgi:hypothetical protein